MVLALTFAQGSSIQRRFIFLGHWLTLQSVYHGKLTEDGHAGKGTVCGNSEGKPTQGT